MKNLDNTIEKHLSAIMDRNIDALLETVHPEKITLILPNGKYSNTFSEYKKVNTAWFGDPDWNIEYDIVEKKVTTEAGIVLLEIKYSDKDEDGNDYSFQYYLSLIFERFDNEWKLVFDQNTIIKD